MSLEMYAFLKKASLPDRDAWQRAIDLIGLPVQLDATLDPKTNVGFSPAEVNGIKSGFELNCESVAELISNYPDLRAMIADRDTALSFRWGGDLKECGCILGAVAALVKAFGAVAYYPEDNIIYEDFHQLVTESRQCY